MADELTDGQPVIALAAEPEKEYRTIQEKKFFANRDASSLPITSTTPPAQSTASEPATPEPPPAAPAADPPVTDEPVVAEPVLAEDDFSVELPGTVPEDGVLLEGAVKHPDSPLSDTAPQWQHDAFNRLQADSSISPEDKKTIAELPPTAWDKARRWQSDTKLLGQFRNSDVPIPQVFDTLTKQSKERVAELETEALNRLMTSGDRMVEFSSKHPDAYAAVMSALINEHSDFITSVLKRKGFNVVKAEPFDKAKILDEIREHPMYETFASTDIAELVEAKINALADRIGTEEVTPEELASGLGQPEATSNQAKEVFQKIQTAVTDAQTNQWTKAIGDGLVSAGIKPATEAEKVKNPAAAHLKTLLYNAALYGLPGVMSGWDEHSSKWGEKQAGFGETFAELTSYLQTGDIARFQEGAPGMNPFYFEFGKRRAQTALIQNLYRAVDKMLAVVEAPIPAEAAKPAPTIDGQPAPNGNGKEYRTNSMKRFFAARGM